MIGSPSRRGSMLLMVLVVVVMMTLAAYTLSDLMFQEHRGAAMYGRGVQAAALVESGSEMVARFLEQDEESKELAGGIYNNPDAFRGLLVVNSQDPWDRGRFTVIAPHVEDDFVVGPRFGLEDESARIHLNTLVATERRQAGHGVGHLMALPYMTEDTASAILDWLDEDNDPRPFGAEADVYSRLSPPYAPKNGPIDTVEELLLVRGVTRSLLFGADADRNGFVDAQEMAASQAGGIDLSGGALSRGWASFLTIHSAEANVQPDGSPRIDLNQPDLNQLHQDLEKAMGKEIAAFIVAYRQYGPHSGGGAGAQQAQSISLDFNRKGSQSIKNILDLVGKQVRVTQSSENNNENANQNNNANANGNANGGENGNGNGNGNGNENPGENEGGGESGGEGVNANVGSPPQQNEQATILQSPFPNETERMSEYLPKLLDHVTVNKAPVLQGRININQAPRTVLQGIPQMTPELVDAILSARDLEVTAERPERRYPTWPLTEELLDLEKMKALLPFVTTGGNVFRAQIVGYFDQGGPAVRIEAVIDTTSRSPQLLFWKDMSHLGVGFTRDVLGAGQ